MNAPLSKSLTAILPLESLAYLQDPDHVPRCADARLLAFQELALGAALAVVFSSSMPPSLAVFHQQGLTVLRSMRELDQYGPADVRLPQGLHFTLLERSDLQTTDMENLDKAKATVGTRLVRYRWQKASALDLATAPGLDVTIEYDPTHSITQTPTLHVWAYHNNAREKVLAAMREEAPRWSVSEQYREKLRAASHDLCQAA